MLKKIILEKNHVIKLYEVTKLKDVGETTIHPTLLALWITIVINTVLLSFFILFLFLNFL